MELQDFIDQVADKIRRRGYRYWHEGRVESLEKLSDGQWWAQVQGSRMYEVRITLDENDEVRRHSCDCPYDGGPVCKHEIAVLFAIAERELEGGISMVSTEDIEVAQKTSKISNKELLERIDITDLKNFVLQYAAFHQDFEQSLRAEFAGVLTEDRQSYRQMVREILGSGSDRHISYGKVFNLVKPLERLVEQGEKMVEDNRLEEAWSIARVVAEEVSQALNRMNDSSGAAAEVVSRALGVMRQIGMVAYDRLSDQIFDFARQALSKKNFNNFGHEPEIWDRLIVLADRPSRENTVSELIDHHMKEAEKEKFDDTVRYLKSRLLLRKYRLLKQREKHEQADQLMRKHPEVPEFVESRVERLMQKQKYEEARKLLEDRIEVEEGGAVGSERKMEEKAWKWEISKGIRHWSAALPDVL